MSAEDAAALHSVLKLRCIAVLKLPCQMCHLIAFVECENVGLVYAVRGVRIVGADPDHFFIRQIVDLNGLAGQGIGAAVELDHEGNCSMGIRQFAHGRQ